MKYKIVIAQVARDAVTPFPFHLGCHYAQLKVQIKKVYKGESGSALIKYIVCNILQPC